MRKYLYLAMAAASVAVLASPVAAGAAESAAGHVLTISKAHGTAVKPGAVLKATLAKKSSAVFTTSLFKLTCSSASFTAVVVKNPTGKGPATESQIGQTVAKCKVSGITGVGVKSVVANNLPYDVSVATSKGDPVTISGNKATKPIETTVTATFGGNSFSCIYKAKTIKGSASNKGNTVTITNQKFSFVSGFSLCPKTATFSATFGPVKDTTVHRSPTVFVN